MSRIIDNLIAYRVLSMLVQPFAETDAYKLGIIDKNGKNLKKSSELVGNEKDAYTYLHRLVFNMKKILNKLPGGDAKLKNLVAALFLIKEYYEKNDKQLSLMEDRYIDLLKKDVILAEEQIAIEKFIEQKIEEDGGAPANATGAAVSTDRTVVKKKDVDQYKLKNAGALKFVRRKQNVAA